MRTPIRPTVAGLLAAALTAMALLLVPASPAAAHNTLKAATPAKDARLSAPPKQITLEFMQKLNPTFTTIALSDATQQKVATSEPAVSGTKGTVTPEEPLANGTYTVAYRVVSADGHPVQGSYRFTVADPTATASPEVTEAASPTPATATPAAAEPTVSASPAAASGGSGGGPGALVLAGAGILLVAVVAVGSFVVLRRRSTQPS
ncbi:copper resistance protein CopC [Micromonospora sp. Llam7]|uniref:copper resistance CopC family protein n=1 Tax=Micromonospora tarapacensis TaxID=2835305 RepID=UPI001C83AC4C|nr:copper resistance protein CopC [Micromonospora tarapacensis]